MNIDTSTPVVVLACPHHSGLGVTRSLGRLGVPVFNVDSTRWAPAFYSRYCRRGYVWDLEKNKEEQSVAKLVEIAKCAGRRCVLIHGTDRAALFVADHAAALEPWYLFPAQNPALVHAFCSKLDMFRLATQHSIPTPATASLETKAARIEFREQVRLPIIVKGLSGQAHQRYGQSKLIIRTEHELVGLYESIGEAAAPELIAQEYIPGCENTVWMFNGYFDDQGKCVAGFTGRKLRQCPVYTGVTSLGICEKNEAVEKAATRLLSETGYRGIVDMDFRYDARDGDYKLLDVNPRLGSTFRLFVATDGLDVVRACYLDLIGQEVPRAAACEGRRWMVEDFDLVSSLRYMQDGAITFRDWIRSLRGINETAFFSWDDLLSTLLMLRTDAAQLMHRIRLGLGLSFLNKDRATDSRS